MRPQIVHELEGFIERGELWDERATSRLVDVLERESEETGDPLPASLAKVFTAVVLRSRMGPIDPHLAIDIEAHVYVRLYKILEACYDDLPDGEIRTRIEVLHRRLSRMLVDENPRVAGPG